MKVPAHPLERALLETVEADCEAEPVFQKIEELSSYRGSSPLALYTGAAADPFKN